MFPVHTSCKAMIESSLHDSVQFLCFGLTTIFLCFTGKLTCQLNLNINYDFHYSQTQKVSCSLYTVHDIQHLC